MIQQPSEARSYGDRALLFIVAVVLEIILANVAIEALKIITGPIDDGGILFIALGVGVCFAPLDITILLGKEQANENPTGNLH